MPCLHFSISIVKGSKGKSVVASAAYNSGQKLYSEKAKAKKEAVKNKSAVKEEPVRTEKKSVNKPLRTEDRPSIIEKMKTLKAEKDQREIGERERKRVIKRDRHEGDS